MSTIYSITEKLEIPGLFVAITHCVIACVLSYLFRRLLCRMYINQMRAENSEESVKVILNNIPDAVIILSESNN